MPSLSPKDLSPPAWLRWFVNDTVRGSVDRQVCAAFDSAPAVYWQAEKLSHDDDLGNHLSFEGTARGFNVWLRILQNPPDWAGPGRRVHASSGNVEDVW